MSKVVLEDKQALEAQSAGPSENPSRIADMPRVTHLTSVHLADDARIFEKECLSLAKAGYQVSYVVPDAPVDFGSQVTIRTIPSVAGRRQRFLHAIRAVYRAALQENADLYHFHDPELIPVGLMLALRGKIVIYDAHEDLPKQVMGKEWIPIRLRRVVAWGAQIMESIGARFFEGIVAATPTIAKRFPPEKTIIAQNFPLPQNLIRETALPYAARPSHVVYVGGLAQVRGLLEMTRAMEKLPDVRLLLAGMFSPPSLQREVERLPGWQRVQFLGWQSRDQIASLLGQARVGLVTLRPLANYLDAYPVKMFEYMAAGIPVVASDFPLWREIVEEAGCGLLVDPLNPDAIAEAIQWLMAHPEEAEAMGESGRKAALEKYHWDAEAKKLLALYARLLPLKGGER